jgi:hypothetical protein
MSARTRAIYTNREVITINQDQLGAGAELVSRDAPGVEVWQRPMGSRTGQEVAVMLLNATDKSQTMHLDWKAVGLLPNVTARDVWTHRDFLSTTGVTRIVMPHSAILLRVHGKRSWTRGITFEAETPSNLRSGNTQLLTCGECSSGYAMLLGGDESRGALEFKNILVDHPGTYQLRILYVRNGLEDKMLDLSVNGLPSTKARAIMRSWNDMSVSVELRAGGNTISIGYAGSLSFALDCIEIAKKVSPAIN